jgi:hypothetical protein
MLCCAIHYVVSDTYLTTSHLACYSNYSCMIDWPSYNESLVRRGQVLLDFDVLDGWDLELSQMNHGKVGEPYDYPDSFIQLLG